MPSDSAKVKFGKPKKKVFYNVFFSGIFLRLPLVVSEIYYGNTLGLYSSERVCH